MKNIFKTFLVLVALSAASLIAQNLPSELADRLNQYSNIPSNNQPPAGAQPISWVPGDDYAAMLTAVARYQDPYQLYNNGSTINRYIQCKVTPGGNQFTYTGPNSQTAYVGADRFSSDKVGQFQMLRYCNWVENGRPMNIGFENSQTTEDGSYTLNGQTNGTVTPLNSGSTYFVGPGEMGTE